jgi:hypothetical protein
MGRPIEEGELYDHSPEVYLFRFVHLVAKMIYA